MKFIDLFSGIGGFRLGMEMAGHECVGHCEIDKFADKSYRAMHNVKEEEWYADDIRAVKPGDLPEVECWCGGFPCQSFSVAGKRRGFEDMRGTLVFEIFRLANIKRPRILFLENVEGLLNHDGGRTFGTIIAAMDEIGYDAQWQCLNSKNFGIPQNRERVFIIGHLRGTSGREVFPIRGSNAEAFSEIESLNPRKNDGSQSYQQDRVYFTEGLTPALLKDKSDILIVGKDGKRKDKGHASCLTSGGHSGGNHSDMDLIVQAVLTPDRLEKRQNGRRFKEPGEEMFTLTGQDRHGVMILDDTKSEKFGGGKMFDVCPTLRSSRYGHKVIEENNPRIRRLTPRECFRLQGFPDEYFERAAAVNSDSQLYKQAGNGVTVNVIYEIAKRL